MLFKPITRRLTAAALPLLLIAPQCAPGPDSPPVPANVSVTRSSYGSPPNCVYVQVGPGGSIEITANSTVDMIEAEVVVGKNLPQVPVREPWYNVAEGRKVYLTYAEVTQAARNMGWTGSGSIELDFFAVNDTNGGDPKSYSREGKHCRARFG